MAETTQVQINKNSNKEIPNVQYSEKEIVQRGQILEEARNAADQRDMKYTELDDMDYITWYDKSKKAVQAYIEPKINEEDVRVVTGTTREKGNVLTSTLLSYNFECDVTSFDQEDQEDRELGDAMEKMVRKSRELEVPRYEVKRPLIYNELVNQGNVFVRESWNEFSVPEKTLKDMEWSEDIELDKIKWTERLGKVHAFCNSEPLTGPEVFPGNIREYFMELQPYIFTRKVVSYSVAKSLFGGWARFKYVSKKLRTETKLENDMSYDDFQMLETDSDLIEIIEYMNKWTNERQIMMNGVMMLPVGFPLSASIGVCEYPLAKGDGEMISLNFFYSRGIGAKTKMDQAILDEMLKMMIIKTRKSYKPPMANNGNYNVGPSIYMPGKIFKNVDPDKLRPIGDNGGVTAAEFNMTQFVKEIIDNKSVTPIMEGQSPGSQATAKQITVQKEQSMMKLGGLMLGVLNLENRMAWLRIYNILKHWTDSVDKKMETTRDGVKQMVDVYRTVSVSDTLENGRKGEKIIDFTEDMPTESQVMAEEDVLSEVRNKPVRKIYIDPKMLKNLKNTWKIHVVPTEKNTDALKATMFEEFLQKIFTIFAPAGKMPNMDYLADRFAQINDEDPDQIWQQQEQQQPQQPGMEQAMAGAQQPQGQVPAQLSQQGPQKPSVNTMMQG